ncbi:type VI secretion system Vgr family protein [Desulfocurvibacter africanus]|uniref:type VI secretion system Vgr family protein n=1 Tax=Desulfocurvibacter africanus TaxID=873 RepID=UPI000423FC61|nr:type VI secretion system tip protein TssI/VgrG [Desulfocurvibacter africanus]
MGFHKDCYFDFRCEGLPQETFDVVEFKGLEGLSTPYMFEVTLVSPNPDIDLTEVVRSRSTLVLLREAGEEVLFHGILAAFEQTLAYNTAYFYRAVLRPAFWRLSLTHHNQVFLGKSVPEILQTVLKDGGLATDEFELRLTGNYAPCEYVCQYQESHFDFVSRWMEREGIYYFFEQGPDREKLVLTDTASAHVLAAKGGKFSYSQTSGLDHASRTEVVKSFTCRQQMLPAKVKLKDYNYLRPSLDLTVEAAVSERGMGEVYLYGEHFLTPEAGSRLARIRAEELMAGEKRFLGESLIPYLLPGFVFDLQGHFRKDTNARYLTTDIEHEGNQVALLPAAAKDGLGTLATEPYYRNSFTAIPAGVQFRPQRKTEKARFNGSLSAVIDSESDGPYADLDEHGRYKVRLPFDIAGSRAGKASHRLRMVQPYVGSNHGMHFPLHKGTEVLLTFIDGDPDRPVISGAVPNPDNPSPVTSSNLTKSVITSAGGNTIHMEDQAGSQRILLHSPTSGTFLRLGAPNDPSPEGHGEHENENENENEKENEKENEGGSLEYEGSRTWHGIRFHTEDALYLECQAKNEIIMGESSETILGSETLIKILDANDIVLGGKIDIHVPHKLEYSNGHTEVKGEHTKVKGESTELATMVQYLASQHTLLAGQTSKLAGEVSKLAGEQNEIAGSVQMLAGNTSQLAGEVSKVIGAVQEIGGERTTISAQFTRMLAEGSTLVGSMTEAVGERISTIGGETSVIGENMRLAGEDTLITSLSITI